MFPEVILSPRRRWYLAWAYSLLVIYASLYPLTGWEDHGDAPWYYLLGGWPRYVTGFDLVTNVLGYVPLGLLWFAALRRRWTPPAAALLAAAIGAGLSFSMETVQTYLPSRVASNVDLASNMLGTCVGAAIGVRWGGLWESGRWQRWLHEALLPGEWADVGLVLIVAWLVTQLSPESLLFGSGSVRRILDLPLSQPFLVERFIQIETVIAASGLLAASLMASLVLRRPSRQRMIVVCGGLVALALAAKTFAHALLMSPASALIWVTPGNSMGLVLGFVLFSVASFASRPVQRAIAALTLLLATVMVNIAPENPYLTNTLEVWYQGHFLNFNGLTRLVCSLWPFLALPWLMLYYPNHDERNHRPVELA